MQRSPRSQTRGCRARSKRSGKPYQAPAVRGWAVCRMHGAGGGAPKGNKNALKHGLYTAEAIAERRAIRALLRESGELLEGFERDFARNILRVLASPAAKQAQAGESRAENR